MIWSSTASLERLLVRRIRDEIAGLNADITDVRQRLQAARDLLQPVVAEVGAARGPFPTVGDRLAAVEARIAALEAAPTP